MTIKRATTDFFLALPEDDQKTIRVLLAMRGVNCPVIDFTDQCCHHTGGCTKQTDILLFCVNFSDAMTSNRSGRQSSVVLVKPCEGHLQHYLQYGFQEL